jgi:hypothetical protein
LFPKDWVLMNKNYKMFADQVLKLLLPMTDPVQVTPEFIFLENEGDAFWDFAAHQVVLLRVYEALINTKIPIESSVCALAQAESLRINRTLALIQELTNICDRNNISFVFTKAFQHYPDMGHDVDLFVMGNSKTVDKCLRSELTMCESKSSLLNFFSQKTAFLVDGYTSPLEIHHRLIGHLGEHAEFPKSLIRNRCRPEIDGVATYIPSREDQLILQVIQRIYGHRFMRLSDIIVSSKLIYKASLDWDYIINTTQSIGIYEGLCYYLRYINEVFRSIRDEMLIDDYRFVDGNLDINYGNGSYQIPLFSICGRLFFKKWVADMRHLNWTSAGRLACLPFFAFQVSTRNVIQRFVK